MKKILLAAVALSFSLGAVAQSELKVVEKHHAVSNVLDGKQTKHYLPGQALLNKVQATPSLKTRADEEAVVIDPMTMNLMTGFDNQLYELGVGGKGTIAVGCVFSGPLLERFHGNTVKTFKTFVCGGAKNIKAYIVDPQTGEPYWQGSTAATGGVSGKEIEINCDYVIDKDTPFMAYYVFEGTKAENSVYVYINDATDGLFLMLSSYGDKGFYDYSGGEYGCAYIDLITEGEGGLKSNDVAIDNVGYIRTEAGSECKIPVYMTNYGTEPIKKLAFKATVNGEVYESTLEAPQALPYMGQAVTALDVVAPAEGGRFISDIEITAVNDQADGYSVDNLQNAQLVSINEPNKRKVVMEEFTGTWCGWCPRGLVAIESLKAAYPNEFAAISVHYGELAPASNYHDPYVCNSYLNLAQYMSFPSALLNRTMMVDPYFGSEGSITDDVDALLEIPCEAAMGVSSELSEDEKSITVNAMLTWGINANPEDYSVAYVLTEDGLTGASQTNYYDQAYSAQSGITLESLTEDLKHLFTAGAAYQPTFNDVARYIEGLGGISGSLNNAEITVGKSFTHTQTIAMPAGVNKENLYVVAILFDNQTGEIVTAERAKLNEQAYATGIEQVAPAVNAEINVADGAISVVANNAKVQVYNVNGQLVSNVSAQGSVSVPTFGMKGVHVVRVVTAEGIKVMKVNL